MFKPFFSILSNKNLSLGNVRILVIIFVRDRTARCRRPLRRGACRLQCVFKAPLRKWSCQSVKDWLRGRKRCCFINFWFIYGYCFPFVAPVAWRDGQYAQAWRLTQFANQTFSINKTSVPAIYVAPLYRVFQQTDFSKGAPDGTSRSLCNFCIEAFTTNNFCIMYGVENLE